MSDAFRVAISGTSEAVKVVESGDNVLVSVTTTYGTGGGGASAWDDLTGTASWVPFNTAPANVPSSPGVASWDNAEGVLNLQMRAGSGVVLGIGSGERIEECHNNTGSTLAEGAVVYVSGSTGTLLNVALADSSADATSLATIGVVTQSGGIPHGSSGYVALGGKVRGINTNAYNDGDILYLSTSGSFTSTKPVKTTEPIHSGRVGYVVKKAGAGAGTIFVDPAIGFEIEDLHNVASAAPTDGQVLRFSTSTNLYAPTTLAASMVTNAVDKTSASVNDSLTIARTFTGSETPTQNIYTNTGFVSLVFPSDGSGSYVFRAASGTVALTSDITKSAVGLSNVENTALSSWTGNTSQSSVGTITTGTWQATAIALAYGGTGATTAKGAVTKLTTVVDDANTTIALATTDTGYVKRCTAATAVGITTPSTDPGDGWSIMVIQAGAGQVTFTAYSGHTINQADGYTKTRKQHSVATLIRVAAGVYNLSGDLA